MQTRQKTTVYLIRHGETMGNVTGAFIGSTDIDLSDTGREQISYLGRKFQSIHLDRVYSSPYKRARLTAESVIGDRSIPLTLEPLLCEIDCGDWEGKFAAELEKLYPGQPELWERAPHLLHMANGETFEDVRARVTRGFLKAVNSEKGNAIAITAHMLANHLIICSLLGISNADVWSIPKANNTSVTTIYIYGNGEFEIADYGSIEHLPKHLADTLAPTDAVNPDNLAELPEKFKGRRYFAGLE